MYSTMPSGEVVSGLLRSIRPTRSRRRSDDSVDPTEGGNMKGFDLVDPSETDANAGRGRPGRSRGQSAADAMEPVSPGNGRYCGRQGQPGRAFSDCPAVNTD